MSGFAAVKWLAIARAQPISVQLEITYRCSCRCVFCYNPVRRDANELTRAEWAEVLDDLRSLGTLFVALTGGDPMTHPDFLGIARDVRERNLALTILTNGMHIDRSQARELACLSPLRVELSLHGASASSHEVATGRPGSFAAVQRAVGYLLAEGLAVRLKTPVTGLNVHEIGRIASLASAWGVEVLMDAVLTPRDDGDGTPLKYEVSPECLSEMVERLAEIDQLPARVDRSEGGVTCGLGRSTLAIDPEGGVYPCIQWRHSSLGNVRQERLVSIWRHSPVRQEVAGYAVLANRALLAGPEEVSAVHFCPALAMVATGEVTGVSARHRLLGGALHRQRWREGDL